MTPPIWKRHEIESPCVNICVIHPDTRLCTGCARTIEEITGWAAMTPEARSLVMKALPDRRAAPSQRRGGRAGRTGRQG